MESFGSSNVNYGNVTNSQSVTVNKTDDEDNQVKQWLSPLIPQNRHQSVQANRVNDVGSWPLKMNEFWEWSSNKGVPDRPFRSAMAIRVWGRHISGQKERPLEQVDITDTQKY